MTILILGRYGQIGWELQRALSLMGSVVALDRQHADLTNEKQLRQVIRSLRPSFIVNAAAYTAVDEAERETELAYQVNARAVKILAEEAQQLNAWLVHYSSDYVFDGREPGPYDELVSPKPLNAYGQTKLAGDEAIHAIGGKYLIFRCSWIYASRRTNFALSVLKQAQQRDNIKVIHDCMGAPTSAPLVADVTALALRQIQQSGLAADISGVYHLAAGGITNWHEYASFLVAGAKRLGMPIRLDLSNIERISEHDYGSPARRPLNSRFNTSKISRTFGVVLADWKTGAERFLHEVVTPLTTFSSFPNSGTQELPDRSLISGKSQRPAGDIR